MVDFCLYNIILTLSAALPCLCLMFHSYVRLPDYQRFIGHFIGLFVATQCDKINWLTDWIMSKSCAGKYTRCCLQYKFAWWSSCFALVNSCNYLLNIEFWLPLQLFFSLGNDRGKGLQFNSLLGKTWQWQALHLQTLVMRSQ
jgi:hypothetical protein